MSRPDQEPLSETEITAAVRDHYLSAEFPREKMNELRQVQMAAVRSTRRNTVAARVSVVLAVATVLLTAAVLLFHAPDELSSSAPDQETQTGDTPGPIPLPAPSYRLVAFRSHGDHCPHCRATELVYRDIVRNHRDLPCEFRMLDLSDESAAAATKRQVEQWHLDRLIESRVETAFLALVKKDGTVVKQFLPSQGRDQIVTMIRSEITSRNGQQNPQRDRT